MSENPEGKINIPQMPWFKALTLIKPYIFKISTPTSSGTGFQVSYYQNTKVCAIATAYHVIWHAEKWEEPIEITHYSSKRATMLRARNRAIIIHPKQDLAFILYVTQENLSQVDLELIGPKKYVKPGNELGWCGFPVVEPDKLCFFSGHISCYREDENDYLVDGNAINGVSGGPAFYVIKRTNKIKICGVVTAYMPSRATGETLPGLCVVTSVKPYQEDLKKLKSINEAKKKAEEEKKEQQMEIEKKPEPRND